VCSKPRLNASEKTEDGTLPTASYAGGLRMKETYSALRRRLEYNKKANAVVDLKAAEQAVFEILRRLRALRR
jgi:hypothetical protein